MKLQRIHLWQMQNYEFCADRPENKIKLLFSTFGSLSQQTQQNPIKLCGEVLLQETVIPQKLYFLPYILKLRHFNIQLKSVSERQCLFHTGF